MQVALSYLELMTSLLPADVDGAEAQHNVAARSGPAKAEHRAEARKEKHLIELVTQLWRVRAVDNFVAGHLALCIDPDVHQKVVLQVHIGMLHLGHGGIGIITERDEFRR